MALRVLCTAITMKNFYTIDFVNLSAVTGGQVTVASPELDFPKLSGLTVGEVCTSARGTFSGLPAVNASGRWTSRSCVDAKSGKTTKSQTITPDQPKK